MLHGSYLAEPECLQIGPRGLATTPGRWGVRTRCATNMISINFSTSQMIRKAQRRRAMASSRGIGFSYGGTDFINKLTFHNSLATVNRDRVLVGWPKTTRGAIEA